LKNVLVIYYTQSGQLLDIAKNVTKELDNSPKINLNFYEIKPKDNFPFPWKSDKFFGVFPESFRQRPIELIDLDNPILKKNYDLIILAYQIWYLTPSIPVNSFLKNKIARELLKNKPVITLIGARNMWIMAQEKVKKLLNDSKANLVGNIALVDKHMNHISVITIEKWMFLGKKKRYLGIFPLPGIAEKDILDSTRFSPIIKNALEQNNFTELQDKLVKKGAVKINPFLVLTDKRANVLFGKWANFISRKGTANDPKRSLWIKIFSIYLKFAIWIMAPIVFILYLLTYIPFIKSINQDKKYYSSVKINQ
jgi:menaquinone-dependent protoporphyrinogen IX oxidase